MLITIAAALAVLLFAAHGYHRGLYRIAAAFLALLLAGILARPASRWLAGPLGSARLVPEALTPLAAMALAGAVIFLLLSVAAGSLLRRRERGRFERDLPRLAPWERAGGAALGAAWGLLLALLLLVGIRLIGNVEEVFDAPAARAEPADEAPDPAPPARLPASTASMAFAETPGLSQSRAPGQAAFIRLKTAIDRSVIGPAVRKADPIGDQARDTLRKLRLVTANPDLYAAFSRHPALLRLAEDPRIQALTADDEIRTQMQAGQYLALLDNPKVAALLNHDTLVSEVRRLDLGGLLGEVISAHFEEASKKARALRCVRCPHCLDERGDYAEMHPTEDAAQRVRMMLMGTSRSLRAYPCPFGNGWHVSRPPR